MRLNIDSNEVKQILEMHSKLRKKVLLEQDEEVVVNQDEIDRKLLDDSIAAGCLKYGKIRFLKGTKKPVYQATTLKSKEVVIFFPDMTYKFPATGETGKWKCSKAEQLKAKREKETQSSTDAQNRKQEYIDLFTGPKYNYLFNVTDIEKRNYTEIDPVTQLKVPAGIFSPNEKFYSDPNKNKDIERKSSSTLNDVLKNQSIDKTACTKNIEDYYNAFKQRNSIVIDPATFEQTKNIVQACKDQHYNNWGVLRNDKKWNNLIDIMSGGSGGPTRSGETSKWRLK
jgi:hypothetical protein